jgi:membrane protein YqaA with SNARE-associated domain
MSDAVATPTPDPASKPVTKPSWYRRLYARVAALAESPHALWMMMLVAVVDGSFFPVPPFAILVPMVIAKPKRWLRLGLLGTGASLFGALLGYGLGHAIHAGLLHLWKIDLDFPVEQLWVFRQVGLHGTLGALLGQNFWMVTLLCLLFPLFKVVTIGSGMVSVPLGSFLVAAAIGRIVRFLFVSLSTALATRRATGRW